MYQQKYYIAKVSGFYQETLEAYGLAKLLDMILNTDLDIKLGIKISSLNDYYKISIEDYNPIFFEAQVEKFCDNPFLGFDYIFKQTKSGTEMPKDLQTLKELDIPIFDVSKEWEIVKNYNSKDHSENSKSPHPEFNIYELLSNFSIEFIGSPHIGGSKQAGMFTRTFLQLYYNKKYFKNFLDGIFFFFSSLENQLSTDKHSEFVKLSFPEPEKDKKIEYIRLSNNHKISKTTFNQLLHPNKSKGMNNEKMKLSELSNEPDILREYLKILGALNSMASIGGNKTLDDYRVYVSVPYEIDFLQQKQVFKKFKKGFYTNSTYKADIFASLLYSKSLLEHLKLENEKIFDFDYTPANYIEGFYVCHFMTMRKSPPKKHAPINLSFIALPKFVKAQNKEEADLWIEILNDVYIIIRNIKGSERNEETGEVVKGLIFFRDFLNTSNLDNFLSFSFWYASFLMQSIVKEKYYVKPFNTQILNKFYYSMQSNLSEIIQNEGFQAVSKAIRKSTVSLQYTPKSSRRFEIRYGLAQNLQNKSKSKEDLLIFIGEFIAIYNTETSRSAEKNGGKTIRSNVKDSELNSFFEILDNHPSRLVGALLASYGFALEKREVGSEEDFKKLEEQASKLGYQLVQIESIVDNATSENNPENDNL